MNDAAIIKKELGKVENRGIKAEIARQKKKSLQLICYHLRKDNPEVLALAARMIAARRKKREREEGKVRVEAARLRSPS